MIFRRVILQTLHIISMTRLLPLPHATVVHGDLVSKGGHRPAGRATASSVQSRRWRQSSFCAERVLRG